MVQNNLLPTTHFSFYAMLLLVGLVQGMFLVVGLLTAEKVHRRANQMLAVVMLLFVYDLFDELLFESRYICLMPAIAVLEQVTDLLYGPCLFFYVVQMTAPHRKPLEKDGWLHLLPGILTLTAAGYLMVSQPPQTFLDFIAEDAVTPIVLQLYDVLTLCSGMVSILIYLVLSLRLVMSHQKTIGNGYSYREEVDLQWLKTVLLTLGGLGLVYISLFLIAIFQLQSPEVIDTSLYIAVILCIFFLGFKGIRQPGLFIESEQPVQKTADKVPTTPAAAPEYQGTGIDGSESQLILEELQNLLARQPIYLEPKLTLAGLAEASGFKNHHISQAINQNLQMNFFDFINRYRIEYACEQLRGKGSNILSVAMESGFNSKSSFYTAFKKHTGMTPKQFQSQRAGAA